MNDLLAGVVFNDRNVKNYHGAVLYAYFNLLVPNGSQPLDILNHYYILLGVAKHSVRMQSLSRIWRFYSQWS